MLNVKATRSKKSRGRKARGNAKVSVVVSQPPRVNNSQRGGRKRKKKAKGLARLRNQPAFRQPQMSDCVATYGVALSDPWAPGAQHACVPVPGGLTYKTMGYARGTIGMGTNSQGWLLVSPALSNDATQILFTNNAYATADIQPFSASNTLTTGVAAANVPNLPFTTAQICAGIAGGATPGITGRIVACGIRVRYMGTELAKAGLVYTYRAPFHQTVQWNSSGLPTQSSNLTAAPETQIKTVTRDFITELDFACRPDEQQMSSYAKNQNEFNSDAGARTATIYPFTGGEQSFVTAAGVSVTFTTASILMGVPTMAVFLDGLANGSNTFFWEYVIHVEYGGQAVAGAATHTVTDIDGASRMLDAASNIQAPSAMDEHRSRWSRLLAEFGRIQALTIKHAIPLARVAGAAARAYRGRYASWDPIEYKEVD